MQKRIGKDTSDRAALTRRLGNLKNGRDEMNLCELPFALLSTRSSAQNIMRFSYDDPDAEPGQVVQRTLTVKGDAELGLPTVADEEIYLAGMKYARDYNNFQSPLVHFWRSEFLDLLGWAKKYADYDRLLKGMHRLVGVRLSYSNAWRDNRNKEWRDQGAFGIFDSFEFRDARRANKGKSFEESSSWFRWSGVLFESFAAGYLKSIDYELARSLGPTARRLYRYLDKQFHPPKKTVIIINVDRLAYTHIGISENTERDKVLKRHLAPAAEELEHAGYLEPMGFEKRFTKTRGQRGRRQAMFVLNPRWQAKSESRSTEEIEAALRQRGVSGPKARVLARRTADGLIRQVIAAMDENRANGVVIRDADSWIETAAARQFQSVDYSQAALRPERRIFRSERHRARIASGNSA